MTKRLTANDYRIELLDLRNKKEALEARIIKRAKEFIKQYPDVQVISSGYRRVRTYIKDYRNFDGYGVSDALLIIESVEQHLAASHPHKQTTMEFKSTQEDICNCDGRDMPTYKDDGKTWCPQCGYEVR